MMHYIFAVAVLAVIAYAVAAIDDIGITLEGALR
jgi:hypothetical protein